jgi:hypothetical protein
LNANLSQMLAKLHRVFVFGRGIDHYLTFGHRSGLIRTLNYFTREHARGPGAPGALSRDNSSYHAALRFRTVIGCLEAAGKRPLGGLH